MTSLAIPEGGGVFLPAAVCARIRHPLLRDLREAQREQVAVAPEIVAAVQTIDAVGARFQERRVSDVSLPVASRSFAAVDFEVMNVSAAAEALGITEQATRRLLFRGTLKGERGPRSWRVSAASVAARIERSRP